MIRYNQLGVHVLGDRNTMNHTDIRALAYHINNKRHNWQAYVLGHKKWRDVQTALNEQDLNKFTYHEKVTFLLNEIKFDTLDSVISIVSGEAVRVDYEAF